MTKLVQHQIRRISGFETTTVLGRWLAEAWAARKTAALPACERVKYDVGENDCLPGPQAPAGCQIANYAASYEAMLNRRL